MLNMFKVNNVSHMFWTCFTPRSSISFVNFEQVNAGWATINLSTMIIENGNYTNHPRRTYTKFSEKLIFLVPWYTYVRVRIKGWKMLVSQKTLYTL